MAKFIKSWTTVPTTLFRLNNGASVSLRDCAVKSRRRYDLLTVVSKVQPKALDQTTYQAPNDASMCPNTNLQNRLVKQYQGPGAVIFALPQGTRIPPDLVLVHERGTHYSLQAAKEIRLEDLNSKITAFLDERAERLTREEWLAKYPKPTE